MGAPQFTGSRHRLLEAGRHVTGLKAFTEFQHSGQYMQVPVVAQWLVSLMQTESEGLASGGPIRHRQQADL